MVRNITWLAKSSTGMLPLEKGRNTLNPTIGTTSGLFSCAQTVFATVKRVALLPLPREPMRTKMPLALDVFRTRSRNGGRTA